MESNPSPFCQLQAKGGGALKQTMWIFTQPISLHTYALMIAGLYSPTNNRAARRENLAEANRQAFKRLRELRKQIKKEAKNLW